MNKTNEKIDRSRLKLLGVLVAGSAAGGCGPMGAPIPIEDTNPFSTLRNAKSKPKVVPVEPAGGEGEGGGGSH